MNTSKKSTLTQKQPYHKPRIERVRLVPEEAVLSVCKGVGKRGSEASQGCNPIGFCHNTGS